MLVNFSAVKRDAPLHDALTNVVSMKSEYEWFSQHFIVEFYSYSA